jgi:hypothetical protein
VAERRRLRSVPKPGGGLASSSGAAARHEARSIPHAAAAREQAGLTTSEMSFDVPNPARGEVQSGATAIRVQRDNRIALHVLGYGHRSLSACVRPTRCALIEALSHQVPTQAGGAGTRCTNLGRLRRISLCQTTRGIIIRLSEARAPPALCVKR